MSQKFWIFISDTPFFRCSGLIIPFQGMKNARKIYNDTDFCYVPVNSVIQCFILVEAASKPCNGGTLKFTSNIENNKSFSA